MFIVNTIYSNLQTTTYIKINNHSNGNINNGINDHNRNNDFSDNTISSNSNNQNSKYKKRDKKNSGLKSCLSCHCYYHSHLQLFLNIIMFITNNLKSSVKKIE